MTNRARATKPVRAPAAALWEWDLATGVASYSEPLVRLVGLDPSGADADPGWWRRRVHEHDRDRYGAAVDRALAEGERWTCLYRVRCADGATLRVREEGFVVAAGGRAVRALGIVSVSERAARSRPPEDHASLRARMVQRERELRTFVESIPQLAWTADEDGWIDFYNPQWFAYTGTTPEQMEGWGWISVHDPDDLPRMLRIWRNAIATGEPWEDEFRLRRGSDGMLRWHLSRALPVRDAEGRVVRWFGTNTDIHDQKLASEEYARLLARETRARQEAEAANRAKDEFLAVVSHELRTPLNAVLGWAEMLRSGKLDPVKAERASEKIVSNARLQAKLIEDLLDVTRIITGKLQLDLGALDVGTIVLAAADALRPTAEAKGVVLALEDDSRGVVVRGNEARLRQIVTNLVGNAIKFTPAGRRIEVSVRHRGPRLRIEVRDEGEGIAPEFLARIFDRFAQADSSTTRSHGGLGLGLTIVRQLVELHGGEVSAASEGPGLGAVFAVELPVLARDAQGAVVRLAMEAPDVGAAVSLAGIKVLAVDDDPGARELVAEMLLACRATVTLASGVHEAVCALKLDRPDVSDIGMPDLDGYALVAKVRALADAHARATPVVALTAYASIQDRDRALRLGFDRYLTKPVDAGRLSKLVAELARARVVAGS